MTSRVGRIVRTIDRHDYDALVAWTEHRRPVTSRLMHAITHAGDAGSVIACVLILGVAGVGAVRNAALVAGFTLASSHAAVQLLKRGVGRPRPSLPQGLCLIDAPDRFSFPSGHAAAALSIALPLAAIAPAPVGFALLGTGILVGLSRCYLGVHYPGDVVVGWCLALVSYLVAPSALAAFGLFQP